jgi:hypothetical protein
VQLSVNLRIGARMESVEHRYSCPHRTRFFCFHFPCR